MPPEPFITFDDISVRIGGHRPIQALSWQIRTGENWVIWGANGAGKTSLAKAILGQVAVVQGAIHRHYLDTPLTRSRLDHLALISSEQHTQLYLREQMLDEMAHFSARPGMGTTAAEILHAMAAAEPAHDQEIIGHLGLESLLDKPISVLSAGEMRKLLIGRALVVQPRMLILDEPFNGLDSAFQERLRNLLDRLGNHGVQMVLITHRLGEIPGAFTHLLHLHNGKLNWKGPLDEFFDRSGGVPPSPDGDPAETGRTDRIPTSAPEEAEPGPELIRMRNISVRYGRHQVLSDVTWTVRAGENWALIGPNGAGKSTLLRLITGDNLQGYANELILFGRRKGSGESVWQIKEKFGYVSEDLQLRYQKNMSGYDVVCSGFFDSVGLYRRCSPQQKQIATQWLETTGIEALARPLFSRLSFGQQRMVLIVRAMVKTPRLLILDEPCNGLDPANRHRLLQMLDLIVRSGTTQLLYVSHRPDEMPASISHRLHIEAGRVVTAGRL